MFPRYKRVNRRYKVKVPRTKMPFEKKTLIQSAVSLAVLVTLCIASFVSPRKEVNIFLNNDYSKAMWREAASSAAGQIISSVRSVSGTYLTFIEAAESRFGIREPKGKTVKAQKTQKHEYPAPPPEAEQPPLPTQEAPLTWHIPTDGDITSAFGDRVHPVNENPSLHTGIDIGAPLGQTVVCAAKGTVLSTGSDDANGNYVVVDHGDGITSVYAHLQTICVTEGEEVSNLIKIGTVGSTGISTGPHLHFEIKSDGESVNPADYVCFEER